MSSDEESPLDQADEATSAKLSLIPHLLSAINRGALIAFIPSHVMDPLAPRDRVTVVPHPHSGEMHAFSSTGK